MSETDNDDDTSVLESVDTEELLEGTKLEGAASDDDKNLGEAIGRAIGAIIGRQIGELAAQMVVDRLSGRDEEDTSELTVTVETAEGDPVQGSTVSVDGEGGLLGGLLGGGESDETDDDGEVTLQLEDGEYTVSVDADEGSATDDVNIEGDDEELSLTVEADEDGEDGEGEDEEGGDDEDESNENEEGEDDEGEDSTDEDEDDEDQNSEDEDEDDEDE
ncbi:hypothetical protein [Halalkalicoccus subterraneus]|uniref:hypothetical protein n=1 Tax=Halalkalicoccus subterraneus TaxID=2675002 RepID=UPI000EFC983A|nr:hypothetical protein [Halalkalicoccus subterraneus]